MGFYPSPLTLFKKTVCESSLEKRMDKQVGYGEVRTLYQHRDPTDSPVLGERNQNSLGIVLFCSLRNCLSPALILILP